MSILRFTTCFALVAMPLAVVSAGCKSNSIASTTNNGGVGIGPSGGTVSLPDGTEVRIPAGALTKETTISIVEASAGEYPPFPGQYTDVGKVYAFLPHGLQFQTPVVVDVAYSGGTNLAVLRAEQDGAWTEVANGMFMPPIAEVSTTTFSFYTVGSTTQAPDGGPSCSGRGPNNTLPMGSFSSGMGTVPGYSSTAADFDHPDVDLMTLVDGYAVQTSQASSFCGSNMQYELFITLTPYTHACGYYANDVYKIGAGTVTLQILSPMPFTTQDYTTAEVNAQTSRVKPTTAPGACSQSANGSSGGICTGATAATITAIDAQHVQGHFSFAEGDSGVLSGDFDVPFCTSSQLSLCCIQ